MVAVLLAALGATIAVTGQSRGFRAAFGPTRHDSALLLRGFGAANDSLVVPSGGTREFAFRAATPARSLSGWRSSTRNEGNSAKAQAELAAAIQLYPEFTTAREAEQRLRGRSV